jgi:hypothetical protein
MPLKKGAKPGSKGFKDNIKEMVDAGHPVKQSVAAAYSEAGQKKKKKVAKKR